MRRYVALLVLLLSLGSIPASAVSPCTIRGTARADTLNGTPGADFICAFAGNDYANGRNGNDTVRGGFGNDVVVGGRGQDVLRGRQDNDRIFGIDGQPNDILSGGLGKDQCYVDLGDQIRGCETIHVSKPLLKLNLTMIQLTPALQKWMDQHDQEGER